MMPVSKIGQNIFICHEAVAHPLLQMGCQGRLNFLHLNGLCLLSFDVFGEFWENINLLKNYHIQRYLDRFYLLVPEKDLIQRQELLDRFFEIVADEYESLIDVQRNMENIRNLIGYLEKYLCYPIEDNLIIDYGCGVGLSFELLSERNLKIIGVDPSPSMRRIAIKRGMTVWSIGDLACQPKNYISGAFASYVFHLMPHTGGLRLLWSRLVTGGVIVANFHKNNGIELVKSCIQELQGLIYEIKVPHSYERHGTYAVFIKR